MVILQKRVPGLTEDTLDRFVTRAKRGTGVRGSVTVLVTTSRELRRLNQLFRGKDTPTDVLSFPPAHLAAKGFAGDVAISADIAAQNARRLGHSPAEEIKILALHGIRNVRAHVRISDKNIALRYLRRTYARRYEQQNCPGNYTHAITSIVARLASRY